MIAVEGLGRCGGIGPLRGHWAVAAGVRRRDSGGGIVPLRGHWAVAAVFRASQVAPPRFTVAALGRGWYCTVAAPGRRGDIHVARMAGAYTRRYWAVAAGLYRCGGIGPWGRHSCRPDGGRIHAAGLGRCGGVPGVTSSAPTFHRCGGIVPLRRRAVGATFMSPGWRAHTRGGIGPDVAAVFRASQVAPPRFATHVAPLRRCTGRHKWRPHVSRPHVSPLRRGGYFRRLCLCFLP